MERRTLQVLLVESSPGDGADASVALRRAGHVVHRCWSEPAGAAPCDAVTRGRCPLDGDVDVVLLVRRSITPRATPTEAGIACAIRAGVPVVEQGTEVLDPWDPWLSGRVVGDVVGSCESAARERPPRDRA